MTGSPAQEFLRGAAEKSADLVHRQVIRRNIDHYISAVGRGRIRFADWDAARQRCHEAKREAISHLDEYLLQFEEGVTKRGGHVFWAENADQARAYITGLAVDRGVKKVVKVKSMVSEEIALGHALEKLGIEALETDLGEYIVQLRQEPPYHIVTPAMHLTRTQIAELFKERIGGVDTEDPPELVAAARRKLRQAFFNADMGISGANFLVADAGMVAITTNEGNGRLCTSLPKIHVALTGIEKVIPHLQDLATFWPVLANAGTGQSVTCYNTLIGGPRARGEVDGPEEFHVVLLDNGRTELLAEPEQREVLHCIRCGACLNACPVYRTVGGHTYGTTYQGPIGSVLTPHLRGLNEFQHLSQASSLCGACTSVCPVKIDLHHHLLHNRRNGVEQAHRPWTERTGFKLWRWAMMSPQRLSVLGSLMRAGLKSLAAIGVGGTHLDPLRPWTKYRAPLRTPATSFRQLWKKHNATK